MAQLFKNNAYSSLGASLTNVATTLTVTTGHGDRFPAVTAPDFMLLTLQDASNNIEVVKVTARTAGADAMTIVRAQDGTTARSWNIADVVELRLTASALNPLGLLEGASTSAAIRTTLVVPTRTGGDASGTWAIAITGNAATATSIAAGATGDLLYQSGAGTTAKLADVATGNALISGGVGVAPSYGKIGLTTHISGTLAVGNGGTGATTLTSGGLLRGNGASAVSVASAADIVAAIGATAVTNAGTATNWGGYGAVPTAGSTPGANGIPRADASGYMFFNYVNSSTANGENPSVSQVVVTNGTDGYYRKASIAHLTSAVQSNASGSWGINITGNAASVTNGVYNNGASYGISITGSSASASSAVTLTSGTSNWATTGTVSGVVGMLGWKNFGNNHVIFDASASTSPAGGAVGNTDPTNAWTATYPTLMGWNGSQTYGVRVDRARSAESLTTLVGNAPSYACRAWVNFNGTGTVAIRASGNVSSITDNGVGDYTINFTTAMPDVNYAITSGVGGTAGVSQLRLEDAVTARTTSLFRVLAVTGNGASAADAAQVNIAIFR